jgi:hypothetical protein
MFWAWSDHFLVLSLEGARKFPGPPHEHEISGKGALRCSKYFFDHSRVRFTANPKLALWDQTLDLRPFRFTKNGSQKNLNPVVANIVKPPIGEFPKM